MLLLLDESEATSLSWITEITRGTLIEMAGRDEAVYAQKASCACENGIFIAGAWAAQIGIEDNAAGIPFHELINQPRMKCAGPIVPLSR